MTTPDAPAHLRWPERARSWVLNILVLDGLSILATALAVRRWAPIEVDADLLLLKKVFLGAVFVCFIFARIALRAPGVRARDEDAEARGRAYFRSRVLTAATGWLALPLGLGYGLTVDPTLAGLAPFWVAAMLLGATALPRPSDSEDHDEPASPAPEPEA